MINQRQQWRSAGNVVKTINRFRPHAVGADAAYQNEAGERISAGEVEVHDERASQDIERRLSGVNGRWRGARAKFNTMKAFGVFKHTAKSGQGSVSQIGQRVPGKGADAWRSAGRKVQTVNYMRHGLSANCKEKDLHGASEAEQQVNMMNFALNMMKFVFRIDVNFSTATNSSRSGGVR